MRKDCKNVSMTLKGWINNEVLQKCKDIFR